MQQRLVKPVCERGSNQRIIHLTPKLREYDFESQRREVEITITNGELAFIGIPTPGMISVMGRGKYEDTERTE